MKTFLDKHAHNILGTLTCFDRIIFKGYLPAGRQVCPSPTKGVSMPYSTIRAGLSRTTNSMPKPSLARSPTTPRPWPTPRADPEDGSPWDRLPPHRQRLLLDRGPAQGTTLRQPHGSQELALDILFRDRVSLACLYKQLLEHATRCFSAEDVLTFFGRKLHGNLQAEVLTDYKVRIQGARIKHRLASNWIKMYDKTCLSADRSHEVVGGG